jgi:hypothetical protein
MTTIIIEKQIDELTIERFEFYQTENKLYLDKYFIMKRENTRKRNYNTVVRYDRLRERDNTITEAEVPFTDEIKTQAINQFTNSIKCLKWSER